jgi:hypothetical protein
MKVKEGKLEIKYINFGTANRVGDVIYINKNMKKYPKLYKAVLNHERKHSSGWNMDDFMLDLFNRDLKGHKQEYWKFVFNNPKSLLNFSPILKIDNQWVIDVNLLIFWIILAPIILTFIILGGIL